MNSMGPTYNDSDTSPFNFFILYSIMLMFWLPMDSFPTRFEKIFFSEEIKHLHWYLTKDFFYSQQVLMFLDHLDF